MGVPLLVAASINWGAGLSAAYAGIPPRHTAKKAIIRKAILAVHINLVILDPPTKPTYIILRFDAPVKKKSRKSGKCPRQGEPLVAEVGCLGKRGGERLERILGGMTHTPPPRGRGRK
jgi:hypothetical protein